MLRGRPPPPLRLMARVSAIGEVEEEEEGEGERAGRKSDEKASKEAEERSKQDWAETELLRKCRRDNRMRIPGVRRKLQKGEKGKKEGKEKANEGKEEQRGRK